MRRRLAAALLAPLLLLTACSGSGTSTSTPSASTTSTATDATPTAADIAALAAVKVTGAPGAEPKVTVPLPFSITAPVARVDTKGTGSALVKGQTLALNLVAVNGSDGSVSGSTFATKPESIVLGSSNLYGAMNDVFSGQSVGVRVLFAIPGTPAAASSATAQPTPAATATPATIWVMEVVSAKDVPTRAKGDAVPPVAGLPTVKLADSGEPSVTMPTTAAPTSLVVQPLIKGSGAVVATGQSITVQYSGWLWDGTAFDSSWKNGAPITTVIGAGKVIPGWDQGLVGLTVGSQVLLIIPPTLGYGATASGSIPANSTLVFVVDILDAS